mmetsp:Transcript_16263/g.56745  ORF Transcript_16263/g.56745 Transcript_16263/m.56745 type:complete len:276 (-) Transcript_16263:484-1311(-)
MPPLSLRMPQASPRRSRRCSSSFTKKAWPEPAFTSTTAAVTLLLGAFGAALLLDARCRLQALHDGATRRAGVAPGASPRCAFGADAWCLLPRGVQSCATRRGGLAPLAALLDRILAISSSASSSSHSSFMPSASMDDMGFSPSRFSARPAACPVMLQPPVTHRLPRCLSTTVPAPCRRHRARPWRRQLRRRRPRRLRRCPAEAPWRCSSGRRPRGRRPRASSRALVAATARPRSAGRARSISAHTLSRTIVESVRLPGKMAPWLAAAWYWLTSCL